MRKVTQDASHAFMRRENFKNGNTEVKVEDGVTRMYLFDNLIAQKTGLATTITTAGWRTATTKERLNGIAGVNIQQVKGRWFLNGEPWDGSNVIIGAL